MLCSILFSSQSINWEWAKSATGPINQEGLASATDTSGNVFIAGFFSGATMQLGPTTLYNSSWDNAFIAKYSPSGNLLWAKSATVTGQQTSAKTFAIATDAAGNAYITGSYGGGGAVQFGSITLPYNSFASAFLVKYDQAGNVLWAKGWGESENRNAGLGIATYANNAVYVTGYINGDSISLGNIILANPTGEMAIFVAKFDTAGNAIWAVAPSIDGDGTDEGNAICTDANGNVCVAGQYGNYSITFGSTTFSNPNYYPCAFTAKYDSLGNVLWAKSGTATAGYDVEANAIAADTNNNIYVTGSFDGNAVYFDSQIADGVANTANFFLVKYDASGNGVWVKGDGEGGTYSTGLCLSFDKQNRLCLGGGFEGNKIYIDTLTLRAPSSTGDCLFVVVMEPSGAIDCSSVLANSVTAIGAGMGICTDNLGNGYICSTFEENSLVVGPDTLPGQAFSGTNVFAAKFMCPDCALTGIDYQLSASSLCPGDSVEIDFSGDSGVSISPGNYAIWLDSVHAILKPDTTTVFTIHGYTSCGVYKAQNFTLPVLSGSVTIASDKTLICSNDSTQICAPIGFTTYYWSNGDTSACIYTSTADNYIVTVSENGNCSATSNQINISVYPPSPVTMGVNGDTLTGSGANAYQWFLNGVAITGATSSVYIAQASGTYTLQSTDANGCVATSTPVVISGIAEVLAENSISIYPNPSVGNWQLAISSELIGSVAEVFDATGRLVFQSAVRSLQSAINIPNAASGIYELRIVSNDFSVVRKLVKM